MSSSRITLAAVTAALCLLALVLGRNSGPTENFSFDEWEQERKAQAPLIERAKVAGETEARPVADPTIIKGLDQGLGASIARQ